MAEIIFERTCNYWIDAGIVGLYDTLNKPVPGLDAIGGWPETIIKRTGVSTYLSPEHLKIEGEEKHLDLALSYALKRIRTTLYDVSTENQIGKMEGVYFNETEGIVKFPMVKPLINAELVLESPRYTDKRNRKDTIVSKERLSEVAKDADDLFSDLVKKGYIDNQGVTSKKFHKLKDFSSMKIATKFEDSKEKIYKVIQKSPKVLHMGIEEELNNIKGALRNENYQTRKNSCFPFFVKDSRSLSFCDDGDNTISKDYCVTCGFPVKEYKNNQFKEWLSGESKNFMPFVEGREANRCFHSAFKESQKCWKCGYLTFFAPPLLFYRKRDNDTYYALPYIAGNLGATYQLYRSLSGKRGLSKVTGADHFEKNYESSFNRMPAGMPAFTLSFYYDLFERLLPKNTTKLFEMSKNINLIDEQGSIFQTALFLKRDAIGGGGKSFILRETTIDRSAYFIKLFGYLKNQLNNSGNGKLLSGLRAVISRSMDKRSQLQRLSVIRASQALTEGRHVFRFLLPILSSDLKEDTARPNDEVTVIINLFQKYDQWLFKSRKEDKDMANIVEQAKNSGWHLSQKFWGNTDWNEEEKKNLIKRYYYSIERAPSPVKFLDQVRHAWKKAYLDSKEANSLPKDMVFHNADDKEDIKKFEVYRVYFLAGMLNGLINRGKKIHDVTEQINNEEVEGNE
jgi:hypothetical protein